MKKRGSGILLHITSLPSPFGIGDMGPGAYRFADFLASAKQRYWQVLPLNPTDPILGNSPYLSSSAFACSPLLISPELLIRDGLLTEADLVGGPVSPNARVDFPAVISFKKRILRQAYERFKMTGHKEEYAQFCAENAYWLDDFSLFVALKAHFQGQVWTEWPEALRDRKTEALQSARNDLRHAAEEQSFFQYIFLRQWRSLKRYCNEREIHIIGDLPIFVDHDSVDVWTHSHIFDLDERLRPRVVAGVPPDYFSKTGQRWGNPLYQWEVLKLNDYEWWFQRLRHSLNMFDWVRIDHFRGFVAYWEIPAGEKTAINGRWVEAPALDFFNHMKKRISPLRLIAEDLGFITPEVREVMDRLGFPGMKVLLFAFGDDLPTNPYAPHNHRKNCVVYTGTHDNNTTRGWFEHDATPEERKRLFRYLGREVATDEINGELVRLGMMSVANTAIFPLQDILGLSQETRMNQPATQAGNWQWRLLPGQLGSPVSTALLEMTEIFGRT